jgi:hypothetical protein
MCRKNTCAINLFSSLQVKNKPRDRVIKYAFILRLLSVVVMQTVVMKGVPKATGSYMNRFLKVAALAWTTFHGFFILFAVPCSIYQELSKIL